MTLSKLAMSVFAAFAFPAFASGEESGKTETTPTVVSLIGQSFPASDSLDAGDEPSADARACLDGLCWHPGRFETVCQQPPGRDRGDVLVRFPSAIRSGDARNDRVAMEWYVAVNDSGKPIPARAVIVVHESGSGMKVGRLIARGLRQEGLHTFMLHLPFYGERRAEGKPRDPTKLFTTMRQAIADARRARDAVAVLPLVDDSHIALQGTSLGGFVSATAASLDDGYDSVFLLLAGGRLFELIENGEKDAAKVREELAAAGLTGDKLKKLAAAIEPMRLAHRLDRERTWLFSGMFDKVVPPVHSLALAQAARLDAEHHVQMLANHYTGIIYLPMVLAQIRHQVTTLKAK